MAYQVLARKWRPRNFSQLVGQEHVVRALTHALNEKRLHHAWLFTGTRGIGKTTIARILAKSLNCEAGISAEPCGHCSACQEIDSGRFVDLLEVDAATNTQVDKMRELLENAIYAPTRGRYKVYVIDEVHMLTTNAFNAMLKTLEEPPEHVKFILATTDPQKIPVTVLSRCLQFNLKQMPVAAIVGHLARILEAEAIPFETAALQHLAGAAAGSMRDALSLTDQAIAHGAGAVRADEVRDMLGTVDATRLLDLLDALVDQDGERLHALAEEMQAKSLSAASALQEIAAILTRIQLLQLAPRGVAEDDPLRPRLAALAERCAPEFIQLAYQIAAQGRQELALAPDEHSGFLMTLLRMLAFYPEQETAENKKRETGKPPVTANRTSTPASPASTAKPAPLPAGTPVPADWATLVTQLNISGLVRQLANNCALVRRTAEECVLRLPPGERHLDQKSHQDKLRLALAERLGNAQFRLVLEVAEVAEATPAQVEQAARRARLDEAARELENDPFVQSAQETLDARIVPDSIQPL
ncbi:MAG: DNA polymerase III subunit gamma/tau [Zoogloeaceae bacterium]|jgi:DNA polymerase-3 subunit gamma/tau|nr:DNA polymerase III subunit gamma/tau [Zoogloeaceae bacterium]